MFDLIVKNAMLVLPGGIQAGELAVKDGKVAALLASGSCAEADEIVDAQGQYLFPGAIDTHVHMGDPGYAQREDFAHCTAAAAVGGYTTIIDMPQNVPATINASGVAAKQAAAQGHAFIDYCFWGGMTPRNLHTLKELDDQGCVAYKTFLSPVLMDDFGSLSYGQVFEGLQILKTLGARAGFHCEDYSMIECLSDKLKSKENPTWQDFLDSRPAAAELIATEAIIELAKATGCKVHICHVTHPDVAEKIHQAQKDGVDITAETCAHYLCMSSEDLIEKGGLYKCAPPLRSAVDRDRLWEYVKNGTIGSIASDHSPCLPEEKFPPEKNGREDVQAVWGGFSSIQSCFQVAFSEGCVKRGLSLQQLAHTMCEAPAKAFGIWGRKGGLVPGFDADFILVDPQKKWEIQTEDLCYLHKVSGYVGLKGQGLVNSTYVRGRLVAQDGKPCKVQGWGEWVRKIKK